MNALKLRIAEVYDIHCKDHTASDFEVCRDPLCEFANIAERELAAQQQAIEAARDALNKHREKALVTCEETCFCWDIETALAALEAK